MLEDCEFQRNLFLLENCEFQRPKPDYDIQKYSIPTRLTFFYVSFRTIYNFFESPMKYKFNPAKIRTFSHEDFKSEGLLNLLFLSKFLAV